MKATVLYYSHKGKTACLAREIAMYLWSKGLNVSLSAISDFDASKLKDTDLLLSGCWTCGWFVIGQHPHKQWVSSARKMAGAVPPQKLLFFTTYKFRTGGMFRRMKKAMDVPASVPVNSLKSKNGRLTNEDKLILDQFIGLSPYM